MAGHSKWANIKRKKAAEDTKRNKLFNKLLREITVAVKQGGPDPESNPRLRMAVQNAKGANMPKDNIERAINKASGNDGQEYQETHYEGYVTHGIAVFVECTTDNVNRTVGDVRKVFNKYGGSLNPNGSLDFLFDQKGIFTFPNPGEEIDNEDFMLELIDAGAEDVEFDEYGYVIVTTQREDFGNVYKKLESLTISPETAELQRVPHTRVELDDEAFQKMMRFLEELEENDDVNKVYHNIEIKEGQMELV